MAKNDRAHRILQKLRSRDYYDANGYYVGPVDLDTIFYAVLKSNYFAFDGKRVAFNMLRRLVSVSNIMTDEQVDSLCKERD